MSLFNRRTNNGRHRQWGGAISEYLPVVILVAGTLISSFGKVGDTVRENTAAAAVALAGGSYVSSGGSGQSGGGAGEGGGGLGGSGLGGAAEGSSGDSGFGGTGGSGAGGKGGSGGGSNAGGGGGLAGGGGGGGDSESSGDSEGGSGGVAIVDSGASDGDSAGDDESMSAAEYAMELVSGVTDGLVSQATDLFEMIFNPGETYTALKGLYDALMEDPAGTLVAMKDELVNEFAAVLDGDPYATGKILGENINPAVALKVLNRLKKFGEVADTVNDINKHNDADPAGPPKKRDEGCSSFVAGTLVWTSAGMSPIENLATGDTVFTRSETGFTDHQNKIARLLRREAEGHYEIVAGDETVKVTAEHPFWRQGSGWTEAKDLQPGDPVVAATGDVVVKSSKYIKGPVSVYNFSVEENHNYFVSAHKLWVHNAGEGPCSCEGDSCSIPHDDDATDTSNPTPSYPVHTEPDTAFFWSGRTEGVGGEQIARQIADEHGGTTLEALIENRDIKMPAWDPDDPAVVQAWKDISAEYAKGVSGTVRAVIGKELRPGNVWESAELPALINNPNVDRIIIIDPVTKVETEIFVRGAS